MTERLLEILNEYVHLDDQMKVDLGKVLIKKTILGGECLFQANQIFSFVVFVEEGGVYYYKVDQQGKERVVHFAFEGDLFTDLESYVTETDTGFYLKALETSVIYILEKRDLEELLDKDMRWERLMRLLMQDAFIRVMNERKDMGTLSNAAHYQKLAETYPDLFQRVPLYLIASYLNVTPEGLSKIRRRLSHK
ncbi:MULTISPECIES: Crp/Fnr family transcriptional regulator [unclassified Aureispira]|uniref:Crp/Fnr family transcriptional regulator n=1 Tax=unclassified Aureispira TaxID=2649989 RepID=UPI00069728FB|nr:MULTISPECIES: Crp/Fnr family transcriptional regulator [unclassified Aureispira]WMX17310.1 Crp/Fnr family transcriptional regulator [Aureispira sp. CCB-E]